ncbi:hypothetical protein CspeluHIS016_0108440 [Cutaneotrichosporon spelunceum]|uniref:Uncharacterized protein n=1 Tax=Cutaneotrichosporon spelunceum TaxID=1672016 RepID=A0AAD3TPF3_9TREE|nr:hypothetical protein CspeluHIS016_0108440 [Cutaneotrichosporon spelunceum]
MTPFSSTASLTGSSPHQPGLSQTSSYTSSPHSSAPPLEPSPQTNVSPYSGSLALSSPFNASFTGLPNSSWSPTGNLATQAKPTQYLPGDVTAHHAQGTGTVPKQQKTYGALSEPLRQSGPGTASSSPYPTKDSKAVRAQPLAPAAAARVQDIARRCVTAAKATRSSERSASITSRSTGTASASTGSPCDQRSASMSDVSGATSLGPPLNGYSPYGGSTDMPPPPVPRPGQTGVPSTSFAVQQTNGSVPFQNGNVTMETQGGFATFVPPAPTQFHRQPVEQPGAQWRWPPPPGPI